MKPAIFDLAGPLPPPRATTVIEASAGTGKTYAIAALVARFVAAGTPLDQVLAVTFSRLATAELREGIRERLVHSAEVLRTGRADPHDLVDQALLAAQVAGGTPLAARFEQALREIDAAAIVTLHTFAKRMLDELGLLADHDRAIELGSDLDVLADEVVRDCFVADERWQRLGWIYAAELGKAAIDHRTERLYPPDPENALRVEFAEVVRAEFERRKRHRQVMDYDDMVVRLTATLADPVTGARAADVLANRFPVVVVDEFQDTDPQQWEFLRLGFAARSTMVLIGDPKQAIYRFRGGDIETYTRTRVSADAIMTMGTNHRSDEPVVRGVEAIFGGADLGVPGAPITLHPVDVRHRGSRLSGPGGRVRLRVLDSGRQLDGWWAQRKVRADLVDQVGTLLDGSFELTRPNGTRRAVRANDIAILVSSNYFGRLVHDDLATAGIASVFTGSSSVFASSAASDWLVFLEGLQDPRRARLRRAMLTRLIDWSSADLAAASGDEQIEMTALITRCARLFTEQGVAAVFETLVAERRLYARLLALPDGEALVTDLRHLAEILNQAQADQNLSIAGLTEWLRRRVKRAAADSDERARRMSTDRPAIRIMTVHAAKGLQFPIVLLPQAADRRLADLGKDLPMVGHLDGERILDVAQPQQRRGGGEPYLAEEAAEDLRWFYVACTRAQSLLIAWWAATEFTPSSPLHRLLMNAGAERSPELRPQLPAVAALPRPVGVTIELFTADASPAAGQPRPVIESDSTPPRLLEARTFRDRIDRDWTRTSYTGLTAAIHGEPLPGSDEPELDETQEDDESPALAPTNAPASALAPLPGGVVFGSLVHAILEQVDPASAGLTAALAAATAPLIERHPPAELDTSALVIGLEQTLTTPLGPLTSGRSLRDLGATNILAELDFELPLGSGAARSTVGDLAALFTALPADDPLQHYGRQLGNSAAAPGVLAGFLTGSIDVVARIPDAEPRYVIFDYKTNRVPIGPDEELTAHHYSPAAMNAAMCAAHYPLQALLYGVALHRYLAWRQPGYKPQTHLGGVGYLFVRGMVGPDNPQLGPMPAGVFTWMPPAQMIVAASQLLAGGGR